MSSAYVKVPKLKKIVENGELDCETKLETIRSLIGESTPLLDGKGSSLEVVPPSNITSGKFDVILKEISGVNEKKIAKSLLQEIEKSTLISWSPESLEVSIGGTPIKYSNIVYLVKRVVSSFPASFPLGIVLFCDALMRIKAPLTLIKNGDVKEIIENLVKINEFRKGKGGGDGQRDETLELEENKESPASLKRSRENEDDGDFPDEKRLKEQNVDSNEASVEENSIKRSFNLPHEKLDKLRRSPRLRKEISEAWKTLKNGKDSKRNT